MKHAPSLASMILASLLICPPAAAQTTQPKRMLGKFEVFSTPARSGYIDTTGKVVIEKNFSPSQFRSFAGGRAAVSLMEADIQKRRWGFIDKKTRAVIAQNYSMANEFSEGLAAVAAPLTPRQAMSVHMFLATHDWFHYPPEDWNHAPDDGWLGNDQVSRNRTEHLFPKWGFIDETGTIVIPLRFSRVGNFREGLAHAVKDKISGFIDRSGNWVIDSKDGKVFARGFSEGLARFSKSRKQGCIDKKGNVIIPPKFHALEDFSQGRAAFATEHGKYGLIDKTGKIVVEAKYKNIRPFSEGLAAAWLDSKWGYLDRNGKIVIPFQYQQAMSFSSGLAGVCINGKWGYIDSKGKMIIAPQFAGVSVFRKSRARVNIGGNYYSHPFARRNNTGYGEHYRVINGHWRYINKSGKFISDMKFDDVLDFRDGLAAFRVFKKYGLKDAKGRIVLPAQYAWLDSDFFNGMARVRSKSRWGFINDSGKVAVRPAFDRVGSFGPGPAAVRVAGKWGHVARDGKIVVKPQFAKARDFSQQLAAVKFSPTDRWQDDRWGYIDLTGKLVIKAAFEEARDFSESLAAVKVNEEYGYIDKSGKIVIKPQFVDADGFSNGLAVVSRVSLSGPYAWFRGVIDKKGKYVIPLVFRGQIGFRNGKYVFGIYDAQSEQYEELEVNRQGLICDDGKATMTVTDYFLPALSKHLDNKDPGKVRDALSILGGMTDPKALKIIRKSLKNRDARTCLLGAEILGRATGQNPLDILIKQLRDAETKIADQVSQAVMLMMSDASTAATFLGKNSSVPEKHRKLLLRHAETRILFGSRTPESWRSRTDYYIFDNEEITDVLSSLISDAGSLHFVDWRGLAEESIEPATAINMRLKKVEINEAWNRLLFEHLRGSKIDSIAIGDIMIISTRDRLGTIARVLSTRPVVGRKTLKKNRAAAKLLQVSVSKLDFEDTKLSQVLQFLRDVSGAKIKMDFNSLVPLGVDPNTPVNMHASDLTLETSLKLMLINIVEPGVLTYKIDDGQIHIVKAPEAPAAPELDPVKVLTGALKHSDKAVRDAAAAALKELRK